MGRFYEFTCRAAKPTVSGGDIFRCTFFTNLSTKPTTSGGAIVLFCVFTGRVRRATTSGGPIFRCTTKDRGERRASSSQAPHPSFCLSGQKLSRSAAPPLPTKPTYVGLWRGPLSQSRPLDSGFLYGGSEGRRAYSVRIRPNAINAI